MFKIGMKVICIKEDNFVENFGLHTDNCPKVNEIVVINEISTNGQYLGFEGYDVYNYKAECFKPLQDVKIKEEQLELAQ